MALYLIQFEKCGDIRFISHLDLMRQFHRAMKRAGFSLAYSQGFNPHPKMAFGQPLSLGYTSVGEYLEFELADSIKPSVIVEELNRRLPCGVRVTACKEIHGRSKTAASLVCAGTYEIRSAVFSNNTIEDSLQLFYQQKAIVVTKLQKKGKSTELDIKPMIRALDLQSDEKGERYLQTTLDAGSQSHLNPEYVMKALCAFLTIEFRAMDYRYHRTELFAENDVPLYRMDR